jgi:maltose-binding protein MalE
MIKQTKIIIAVLIVLVLAVAGYFAFQNNIAKAPNDLNSGSDVSGNSANSDSPANLVGGDRDEHGCIGSAGYSWCAPKNKCLRVWEEKCYENIEQEIQYLLAQKYNKSADEVKVTITKQDDTHVAGSVLFGKDGSGEGGSVLAVRTGDVWEIVYDGNGNVDCDRMRQEYLFSDEILKPNFCD